MTADNAKTTEKNRPDRVSENINKIDKVLNKAIFTNPVLFIMDPQLVSY